MRITVETFIKSNPSSLRLRNGKKRGASSWNTMLWCRWFCRIKGNKELAGNNSMLVCLFIGFFILGLVFLDDFITILLDFFDYLWYNIMQIMEWAKLMVVRNLNP